MRRWRAPVAEPERLWLHVYAANSVRWVWLVDPIARTLEIYVLDEGRRWGKPSVLQGAARVRAVPFDAIERLRASSVPPSAARIPTVD